MISATEIAVKYNNSTPEKLAEILGLKIVSKDNLNIPGVTVFAELSGDEIIIYPVAVGKNKDLLILHEICHFLSGNKWLSSESEADNWATEYLKKINK